MTVPHLTVAIATTADRVGRIRADTLAPVEGVTYHLFVQGKGSPVGLGTSDRTDILITMIDSIGVAHSRNAALNAAPDGILLFADDDLVFDASDYGALRDLFAKTPKLDFICGQLGQQPNSTTQRRPTKATRFNTGRVGTPQIAVRLMSFRRAKIQFDPGFGAGSPLWLGDEYIFLCDAIRAGLKGYHANLTFGAHPFESSGKDNSAASFGVRTKVFRRAHRPTSWPWRVAFAVKSFKRFPDWQSVWQFIRP